MTEEEKKLLLIDLCGRLPYGVVLNVPTTDGSENKKLVSIDDGCNGCSNVVFMRWR